MISDLLLLVNSCNVCAFVKIIISNKIFFILDNNSSITTLYQSHIVKKSYVAQSTVDQILGS
jgi:hypothetical protein